MSMVVQMCVVLAIYGISEPMTVTFISPPATLYYDCARILSPP